MVRNPEVQNSGEYRTAVLSSELLSPVVKTLDDNLVQTAIEKGYFNGHDSEVVIAALNDFVVSPSPARLAESLRAPEGGQS